VKTLNFIFIVKARGRTPVVEPSPRIGADADVNAIASTLDSCSRRDQANLKADCLRRDNYRCVVTGVYDFVEARRRFSKEERKRMTTERTECAHIIPFSFGSFAESQVAYSLLSPQ
jgi:hypothetical protein